MSAHRTRRIALVLAAVALLAAMAWVAARSGPLASVRVTVAQAVRADVTPTLFGIGVVEARRSYLVGPVTAGRVKRVVVDVGESVRAGQLLAEMDPVDLDQRLAASSAAAIRARNAVDTAAAQLADGASRLEVAAANARRYDDLGQKGFVSTSVAEGKVQELKSAQAQLAAAEASLAGARQDQTRLVAERDAAQQQRSNLRLVAPADGIVSSRDAEPGSTVIAGQAVVRLIAPDSLWIRLRLDQNRSAGLQLGLPAEIALRSRPGQSLAGKVARIDPLSDSVTEERIAQVSFASSPGEVSVGEMSEVTLRLPGVTQALVVPNAALRRRDGVTGVWTQASGALQFVPVKTGVTGPDGRVQILDGLKEGDVVIVYSERDLVESTRIKVVPALATTGS